MAASPLQPTGLAPSQSCNKEILVVQQQGSSCGHSNTRNVNEAPWVIGDSRFLTFSCSPAKLQSWEEDNSNVPGHLHFTARQEFTWRQFFLDPTRWWDKRPDNKTTRSPDFRHREVLWQKNVYNPAWLESQLAKWDEQMKVGTKKTTVAGCEEDVTVEACSKLCEKGQLSEAIRVLDMLVQTGPQASIPLFCALQKGCVEQKNLALGRRVHALAVRSGYQSNTFLANHFLRMYASHGRLQEARDVFASVASPDVFMWSSIIRVHDEHGEPNQAVQLYHQMCSSGVVKPDGYLFVAAIKACANASDLESGKQVHAAVFKSGLQENIFVGSCLVDMYVKLGRLDDARCVFDTLLSRNVVTWTALISGYGKHGLGHEALSLYAQMEQEGLILANNHTFSCLLKACASIGALQRGKQIHSQIVERGLDDNIVVGNSLVDMYAKCGSLEDAQRVFDNLPNRDVVTWTAMICGYTDGGLGQEALSLYARMELEGLTVADNVTFACLLKACASLGASQQGKKLHLQVLERGLKVDRVMGTCLVDMYAKCGNLEDARMVFDSLPTKDVVTWATMIAAYTEHGLGREALSLYFEMQGGTLILANNVIFACLLRACASMAAIHQGKRLHADILRRKLDTDVVVASSLVDMYAKCGNLEEALKVFDSLTEKDVIIWTAMVNGFGQCNEGKQAIQFFQEMLRHGVQPNETTFLCLLSACSHGGLVNEGRQYFSAMVKVHNMLPCKEHYMCMVDLLGRSGHLDEAEQVLLSMPFERDMVGYMSLLTACRSHGDIERGRRSFESLICLDPQGAAGYVLMANIYADAGMWGDVGRIESLRKSVGANKKPAQADIEVNMEVHTFVVGEQRDDVSFKSRNVNARLMEGGHVPHTKLVLRPVSEKEKEDELCGHAEKLALAYGLLNTPDGTPLLVTKNLRMCGDCHCATQIMSRIERREIIVRDAHRVHRFVEGSCSCGNRP